jgi:hypothetical protein
MLYAGCQAKAGMPVDMLSTLYLLICQMLWVPPCIETTIAICCVKCSICFDHMLYVICRLSYAKAHMSFFICWMPCASCCKFTLRSVICLLQYQFVHAKCFIPYAMCYMPAHECQISVVRCQVCLYANLDCFMTNCYLSVNMPNALSHMLRVICRHMSAKYLLWDAKFAYMPI